MLQKIVSGGQTGADQAAWRAAKAFGIPLGGWMPKGFLTEEGPRPEFAELYGAVEMPTERYAARTEQNVRDSDGTLWFGDTTTSGATATVEACLQLNKPCLPMDPSVAGFEPSHVVNWLRANKIKILNAAGNRESDEPGIAVRVESFLAQVFEKLGLRRA